MMEPQLQHCSRSFLRALVRGAVSICLVISIPCQAGAIAPKKQPARENKPPLSIDPIIKAGDQINAGNPAAAARILAPLLKEQWPEPFDDLVELHALAVLYVLPGANFSGPLSQSIPAARRAAAVKLGIKVTDPVPTAARPAAFEKSQTPALASAVTKDAPPQSDLHKLMQAWKDGKHSTSRQLALKARKNRHGRSCNPHWAYAQFVLARLARAAQNRPLSHKHQTLVADHLTGSFCDANKFEMTKSEFDLFRSDNILWSARLHWEFQELQKADRLAALVLDEAIASNNAPLALEAAQVLHGRIRYESLTPKRARNGLEELRETLRTQGLYSDDFAEYLSFRIALLSWEVKDTGKCQIELQASANALGEALTKQDSFALRRDYTKHLYWLARCAAGSAQPTDNDKVQSIAATAVIERSRDLILRLSGTGYYAMLMQQEFPEMLRESTGKELPLEPKGSNGPQLGPVQEPLKSTKEIEAALSLIETSKMLGKLPRNSLYWSHPAAWLASRLKHTESRLFETDKKTLTRSWDFLLDAMRISDVVLGAGRVAQDLRLDEPIADAILAYLYPPVYLDSFSEASEKCNVETVVLYSVARQESLFDPFAVSPAGAQGLLQLMPTVWRSMSAGKKDWKISTDPFDHRSNAILGACHLGAALKKFENNIHLALAAYNAGAGAASDWYERRYRNDLNLFVEMIPYGETQNYVKQITRNIYHAPRIWRASPTWARLRDNALIDQ